MPRPFFSVLSLPFWQDRKEGHHAPTKPRMRIQGILSKHEVTASATKIYRLAPTVNPPLDGGPAALPTARGFSRGNPLSRSLPSFCRYRKKGPAGQALEEMPFKITEKGIERTQPKKKNPHIQETAYRPLLKEPPCKANPLYTPAPAPAARLSHGRRAYHFDKKSVKVSTFPPF